MLSKNEAKYIQSLSRKKQRLAEGLFIAEGVKLVDELLQSQYTIRKLYATAEWMATRDNTNAVAVTAEELARISGLQTPNQVLAIVEQPKPTGEPVLRSQLTIAVDGIQDPGNLGTIIRIADWFGITQLVAGDDTVELYNPKLIQATMGSFTRVQVWYRSLTDWLPGVTVPVYGAVLDGKNMYETSPVNEGILLIGNEARGIAKELLPFVTHPVTIPASGKAESLNAAVATGILVAQLKRPG